MNRLPRFNSIFADDSEFYFFHFLGLSTNWKKLPLKETVELDSKLHIKEPLIKELCEKSTISFIPLKIE